MKNIITILLILIIPVGIYLFLKKDSESISAFAKANSNPSILIFTSTMCMDCQKMKKQIKEIEGTYDSRINFIPINATDRTKKVQDEIKKHNVTLVPTLIFVTENGTETNRIEGFIEKEELIMNIEEAING